VPDDALLAALRQAAPRFVVATDSASAKRLLELRASSLAPRVPLIAADAGAAAGEVLPLGQLLELGGTLDTAERAQAFRLLCRRLDPEAEALWHVFVTTDAPMDLLIEGEPTVRLGPWQAHFFKGGTMHGFHNPNARTVRWVEFFALKTGTAVALDESAARAIALALAKK